MGGAASVDGRIADTGIGLNTISEDTIAASERWPTENQYENSGLNPRGSSSSSFSVAKNAKTSVFDQQPSELLRSSATKPDPNPKLHSSRPSLGKNLQRNLFDLAIVLMTVGVFAHFSFQVLTYLDPVERHFL